MTVNLVFDPFPKLTDIEQKTVFAVEKLLDGLKMSEVNRVLGYVITESNNSLYRASQEEEK